MSYFEELNWAMYREQLTQYCAFSDPGSGLPRHGGCCAITIIISAKFLSKLNITTLQPEKVALSAVLETALPSLSDSQTRIQTGCIKAIQQMPTS